MDDEVRLDARSWMLDATVSEPALRIKPPAQISLDYFGFGIYGAIVLRSLPVLSFKILIFFGCFFGALPTLVSSTSAQTVGIRLFEIFHPPNLEITSGADELTNGLMKKKNRSHQSAKNWLIVAPSQDTLGWIRITLTPQSLEIQSAHFTRSLPLADTIKITATDAYFFAGQPNHQEVELAIRRYSGSLRVYVTGHELCVINIAPIEDYLAGVLAAEMPNADLAALQSQAVVSRTYMIKNWLRHEKNGYQFCDLTHCQTYKGSEDVTEKIKHALATTKDEILTFDHQLLEAYYSSTCGGRTADDAGVWTKQKDQSYLKSIVDAASNADFCAKSPHYRWRAQISADSLCQIWQRRLGEQIISIVIAKKGADGRVRELALMGHSLHLISGEDFRAITCRVLGWNTLKSTAFDLRLEKAAYVFDGRGLGHGLGLCQYGAMEMARQGYSYQKILQHYFPDTKIQKNVL